MLIDFHTHIFPDKIAEKTVGALANQSGFKPYSDGTQEGLIKAMERADADISVSLPVLTKPTQFESVLNFAKEVNERYSDKKRKIISFAGMHPDCEDVENKLKQVKSAGIKGIKIHPDYQGVFIDDERYIKILSVCKDLDLICVTHSGVDDGYKDCPIRCTVDRVIKVIEKVKYNKFVLGHFGANKAWQEVYENLCDKDVYFDTAFTMHEIDKELFNKIILKHGEDKILFATDSPWRDIKEDRDIVEKYVENKQTKEKIFYKNAIKLLGL